MISKTVRVGNENGLEARSLAMIVQIAGKYSSTLQLECGTRKVNAKSIMGMMALAMDNGDEVTILADGQDEEAAVAEMGRFLEHS